ncbi:MAG: carbohydrate kinase family protein [Oscillospiraceae bacterium]|nr:carbohydrate kinase family protein [Oscillospiraceae bacterium]
MDYCVYLGDVALDEYYRAPEWPVQGDKVYVDAMRQVPGGMIANAACVCASLGVKTYFSSILNRGPVSRFLLEDLEKSGVDTSLVFFDDTLADSKVMIFMTGSDHTMLIPRIEPQPVDIGAQSFEMLKKARYVYTTPNDLLLVRCGALHGPSFADALRADGAKLVCDVDVDYARDGDEERFRQLDIGLVNELGVASVCAGRARADMAAHLLELGMELVVVTLGAAGCEIYSREGCISVPAKRVDAVDVTGAGDTFCSSFMAALTNGKSLRDAAAFATAAASICVSHFGARSGAVGVAAVEEAMRS